MRRLSVFILLICSGCFSTWTDDDYTYVDPLIKPYVDQFVDEANKRGIEIDLHGVSIGFGKPDCHNCGAQANHKWDYIIVDSSLVSWKKWPTNTIFHEMGHLFLHRGHDDRLMNGYPRSIMNSGSKSPRFDNDFDKREYYVDELFNPSTPEPTWVD